MSLAPAAVHITAHLAGKLLANDGKLVNYRPEMRAIAGDTLAGILLSRIWFWWNQKDKEAFYKFNAPCQHEKYRPGDSWREELGFTRSELTTALGKIATKIKTGMKKSDAMKWTDPLGNLRGPESIVLYWRDSSHFTWYWVNEPLFLAHSIKAHYPEVPNAEILHYLVMLYPDISSLMLNPDIRLLVQKTRISFISHETPEDSHNDIQNDSNAGDAALIQEPQSLEDAQKLLDTLLKNPLIEAALKAKFGESSPSKESGAKPPTTPPSSAPPPSPSPVTLVTVRISRRIYMGVFERIAKENQKRSGKPCDPKELMWQSADLIHEEDANTVTVPKDWSDEVTSRYLVPKPEKAKKPVKKHRRETVQHPDLVQPVKDALVAACINLEKWHKSDIGKDQYREAESAACDLCDIGNPVLPEEAESLLAYVIKVAHDQDWSDWPLGALNVNKHLRNLYPHLQLLLRMSPQAQL
jgi:hypothetical protein